MKVIYFDIENTPLLGYAWGTYQQNLLSVEKDTELLCFAYKIGDGKTEVVSRRNYTERQLVKKLWKLFNEADVLVAHNGDSFDIKMANQYFMKFNLSPPAPYKTVDTKKVAKKVGRFAQNKLDYLSQFLLNKKKLHTDISLWFDCMAGDEKALKRMEVYNIRDVDLLYAVHKQFLGWTNTQVNYNVMNDTAHKCPHCGGSTQKRGFAYTRAQKYQRYQCVGECKGWSTGERIPLTNKVIK
tara:strand:+ start:5622 stop:6341 length:720 start_codon:yes stop_codon:yes gene_type:complete